MQVPAALTASRRKWVLPSGGSVASRSLGIEVLVAAGIALYASLHFTIGDQRDAVVFALLGGTCVALVLLRRSAPLALLAVGLGVQVFQYVTDREEAYVTLVLAVALFSVVVRATFWFGSAAWVGVSVSYLATFVAGDRSAAAVGSSFGFFACAWGAGLIVRHREQVIGEVQAAAAEVEANAAAREQMAVLEERNRLRDDLHDIVGHHVNLAAVLADTARTAYGRDDERALSSLDAIGAACRSALDEMEQAMRWLSIDAVVEPTPSLRDLDDVIESVRHAGLVVDHTVAVSASELNRIDLVVSATASRFLREALTNVIKHSSRRWCRVEVASDARMLTVTVVSAPDDLAGTATSTNGGGSGSGLRRLRRRVELLGGTLDAGKVDAGFCQRAAFPLHRGSST